METSNTSSLPSAAPADGGPQVQAPPRRRWSRAPGPEPDRRSAWLLTVCCVAQFMVILDLSIVNVALPSIQSSLGFTASELQWVIDAYAITFAGFLMLGGRAADQFGQRRTFVAALLVFSAGLAHRRGGQPAARCSWPRGPCRVSAAR